MISTVPIIYCDMDGVLNELQEFFIYYVQKIGYTFDLSKVNDYDLKKGIVASKELRKDIVHTIFTDNYFWLHIPVSANAITGLKYLNDNYLVFILTTPYDEKGKQLKIEWLDKYFPFISTKQVLFSSNKWKYNNGIIIEDCPENIENYNNHGGITVKKVQPYNLHTQSHFELFNWNQIETVMNSIVKEYDIL